MKQIFTSSYKEDITLGESKTMNLKISFLPEFPKKLRTTDQTPKPVTGGIYK